MNSLFSDFDAIVVLDTETTGLSMQRDEIIEIGAVRLRWDAEQYVPDGELSCLISLSEGKKLPPEIVKLTGITQELLEQQGIEKREAACRLQALLSGERVLLVAYNAQFDLNYLYYFLARCDCAECLTKLKFLDALTVYRDRRPYPHRLENAIDAYGLGDSAVNSHRAVDDAMATVELLRAMAKEKDDLSCYVNLFGYHPKYGVSGKRIRSIHYCAQPYQSHPPLYVLAEQAAAHT